MTLLENMVMKIQITILNNIAELWNTKHYSYFYNTTAYILDEFLLYLRHNATILVKHIIDTIGKRENTILESSWTLVGLFTVYLTSLHFNFTKVLYDLSFLKLLPVLSSLNRKQYVPIQELSHVTISHPEYSLTSLALSTRFSNPISVGL